ncbi:MAG: hypothetical protein H0W15_07215 [Gemmatimonadales bacterium]|nr:hypothetical protein [Gemmatimonadales bacterium]
MDTDRDDLGPELGDAISTLRDREPEQDLWPTIEAAVAAEGRPGFIQVRRPVLIAAGLALIAASVAITVALRDPAAPAVVAGVPPAAVAPAAAVLPAGFDAATVSLERAIEQLEASVAMESSLIDPETRSRIDQSLAALNGAIADARTRADAAPRDVGAARYLTRTMQRKLNVLQSVASMTRRS